MILMILVPLRGSQKSKVTKAQPAKQAGATSAALGERPVSHVVKSP